MATDFLLAGYQAIKALIVADASLYGTGATVRSHVWFDGDDPQPEREKKIPAKQPGDLPELKLDWDSMTGDSQRTLTRTFGNVVTGSTCPFIEEETHDFTVTITVDDVRLTTLSAILSHVRRVLRAGATVDVGAGAKCRVGKLTSRNVKTAQNEAHGHYRRIATLRVPVTITYTGSDHTT